MMPNILQRNQFMQKKINSVMLEKSYKTVFEIAQGLQDSKTSDLNCSYEVVVQKEALTTCQDRVLATFLWVLSLSSVLGRIIHLYCDTSLLGRSTLKMGSKAPPLYSGIPNIFAVNILSNTGKKPPALKHFLSWF